MTDVLMPPASPAVAAILLDLALTGELDRLLAAPMPCVATCSNEPCPNERSIGARLCDYCKAEHRRDARSRWWRANGGAWRARQKETQAA